MIFILVNKEKNIYIKLEFIIKNKKDDKLHGYN